MFVESRREIDGPELMLIIFYNEFHVVVGCFVDFGNSIVRVVDIAAADDCVSICRILFIDNEDFIVRPSVKV